MITPNIIGLAAQLQNGKDTVAKLIQYLVMRTHVPHTTWTLQMALDASEIPHGLWKTRRFAGKLKEMSAILIGCKVSDFENDTFKNTPLGEEWKRWYMVDESLLGETENGIVTPFFSNREDVINHVKTKGWHWLEQQEPSSEILTPRKILQLLGTEGGRDVIHPNIWVNATLGDLTDKDHVIITDTRFPNEVEGIKKKGGITVKIIRPSKVSTSSHPSETALNDYKDWDYVIVNDGTLSDLELKVKDMLLKFNLL